MINSAKSPFFISIPHSGETVPPEVEWLSQLSEPHLMRDVDRYVDKLYEPVISGLKLPNVQTQWHRYVIDLNRAADEFDETAVVGAPHPAGTHPKGLHWCITTHGETLISEPMTMELHNSLVEKYYVPFNEQVKSLAESFGSKTVYHLDAHSMPSKGTALHSDPGQTRAEIVVSDYHGTSCSGEFKNRVVEAYQQAGFEVAYNWPYVGGGITRRYGKPKEGFHTIQVEINRALYMDESNKQKIPGLFDETSEKIKKAVTLIVAGLGDMVNV